MFEIPQKIEYVLNRLKNGGFKAYIVGGCVRDMLMGITPHDYDVTTSALPEQIISLFSKTIPTGIKHGTVTVISEGEPVEVTTYRTECGYSDCRRPDSVVFVSDLKADLSRRDFTANAMAYNNDSGLQDFFGGQKDIKNQILRAVGDPSTRFHEDALRILRLFRFSSVLGFKPEHDALTAAIEYAPLLKNISRERIMTELVKAVSGKNPAAIKPLIDCGGLSHIGLESAPDFNIIKSINYNPDLALFSLFYISGANVITAYNELKTSNKQREYADCLTKLLSLPFPFTKPEIKEMLNISGENVFRDYLSLQNAMGKDINSAQNLLDEIIDNKEPYRIKDLAIGGDELLRIGITGEAVGRTLQIMRQYVVNNPDGNNKESLLKLNRN